MGTKQSVLDKEEERTHTHKTAPIAVEQEGRKEAGRMREAGESSQSSESRSLSSSSSSRSVILTVSWRERKKVG